jgi:GT2 family glycosyltransferase
MEVNPQVGVVGPRQFSPDKSEQPSCYRWPSLLTPLYRRTFLGDFDFAKKEIADYLMEDFDHNQTKPVDWILGACVMVRRSALDKIGLMDEDLFLYFGDVAWCKKFWQAGYKVYYFIDANIVHYHKRESAQSGFFSKILGKTSRPFICGIMMSSSTRSVLLEREVIA